MKIIFKNFRIVDDATDSMGKVIAEDGIITNAENDTPLQGKPGDDEKGAALIIDGAGFSTADVPILMPAFVDLHAHFRDPGFPDKENLESASLSAAAGGFGTVVCMANTMPVIDSLEKVLELKARSDRLSLVDLHPVMTLSKGMEGTELSGIKNLLPQTGGIKNGEGPYIPLMLSEDGKDVADDDLFLAAMKEAKRIGIPVSCHCDLDGEENAVRRAIELGKKAGCHIHIAHVSTKGAIEIIRKAKADLKNESPEDNSGSGFILTCEVMPHNLCLTKEDAKKLGEGSFGRVNPPLRSEEDRKALILAIADGTIDAVATDHAPHSRSDKEKGSPGFSGFETAFAAFYTELIRPSPPVIDLKKLSSLMSCEPAKLLGFESGSQKRGRILPGWRADLVIVDPGFKWIVESEKFKTKGKNSPFAGRELFGGICMTIHRGKVVYEK